MPAYRHSYRAASGGERWALDKMPSGPATMTATQPKPRNTALEVTIYTRGNCHLCDEAKTAIAPLLREFGATVREIDLEGDATLMQRFGCDIPVIYIGRKKAAKHRVNLEQFRRQLQEARERFG
jgi:glutaredoxin